MDCNSKSGKSAKTIACHSIPHRKASKPIKACDGAGVLDGLATLQNFTLKLVASTFGVSISSLIAAQRLTPAQRDAVRRGLRSLALPKATPLTALPAPNSAEQRMAGVVAELGLGKTLDALAAMDAVPLGPQSESSLFN
jgi:hypothetical protein